MSLCRNSRVPNYCTAYIEVKLNNGTSVKPIANQKFKVLVVHELKVNFEFQTNAV